MSLITLQDIFHIRLEDKIVFWLSVFFVLIFCADGRARYRERSRGLRGPIASRCWPRATVARLRDGAQLEIWEGRRQTETPKETQRPHREAFNAGEGRSERPNTARQERTANERGRLGEASFVVAVVANATQHERDLTTLNAAFWYFSPI